MKLSANLIKNVIRIFFGVVFSIIGYQLGGRFLRADLFGIPRDLLKTILAFLSGAVAIFILPLVVSWIVNSLTRWVAQLIQTTVAKALTDFWSQRTRGKFGKKEKEKKDEETPPKEEGLPRPVLLDTSVIIDGRILDVVNTGFFGETFIVPRFVLEELQKIADSDDRLRRERGRRGLKILEELKNLGELTLKIVDPAGRVKDVDSALLKLARKYKGKIATVDFNLNKVAQLSGVKILNVNELANAIKTVVLPGERLKIKIIQPGKEAKQGVGYLPDGTMIVVENGAERMGKEVEAEVSRILQTAAGRMVFAQIK